MKFTVSTIALLALMSCSSAHAQMYSVAPGRSAAVRFDPYAKPVGNGCGGFGTTIIKWIEESADSFSRGGQKFLNGSDARTAVGNQVHQMLANFYPKYYSTRPLNQPFPVDMVQPGISGDTTQAIKDAPQCFPKLAKLMTDADARGKAEQEAAAERAAAEQAAAAERSRQAAAAREIEQKAKAERDAAQAERQRQEATARAEAAAKQEAEARAEAAKPDNRIRTAYSLYIRLRWCSGVREGYLVKYINDVEMERVETAIKAIVSKEKSREPDMNTDQLWQQADRATTGMRVQMDACQYWFHQLLAMSPVPAIRVEKPE
jgi:hypothetical protein